MLTRSGWMVEAASDTIGPSVTDRGARSPGWSSRRPASRTGIAMPARPTISSVSAAVIKLALWDGRDTSSTTGSETKMIRDGRSVPVMVVVPPGVWHALRNESGQPAGYINVTGPGSTPTRTRTTGGSRRERPEFRPFCNRRWKQARIGFGDAFCLTLITDDVEVAAHASTPGSIAWGSTWNTWARPSDHLERTRESSGTIGTTWNGFPAFRSRQEPRSWRPDPGRRTLPVQPRRRRGLKSRRRLTTQAPAAKASIGL